MLAPVANPPTPPVPARQRTRAWAWLALVIVAIAAAAAGYPLLVDGEKPAPPPSPNPDIRWPVSVRTVAGSGAPGLLDGTWSASRFSDPFDVAVDTAGNVFVTDAGDNNSLRRVSSDGRVTTFAGGREGFDDGDASTASFRTPSGIAFMPDGRLVVADTGNNAIRVVTRDGHVATLAGDGVAGSQDGVGRTARFNGPIGVAAGPDGSVYVADTYNDRVRRVAPDGTVTTIAGGGGTGYRDGTAAEAIFDTPSGIAVTDSGDIVVADTGNNLVRRISDGSVFTIATEFETTDVPAWVHPVGVAASGAFLYVTDANRVSIVEPGGRVRTLAGAAAGSTNGAGSVARFDGPMGIDVDAHGTAWVADSDNYMVRRLSPPRSENAHVDIDLVDAPILTPATLRMTTLPWPVDGQQEWHELAATIGEARGSYGGDGRERLHSGIDVKADIGEIVRSVRDEVVQRPISSGTFESASESLRVGVVFYVHVRVGRNRFGRIIDADRFSVVHDDKNHALRVRVKRGTRFRTGDPIGTVNRQAHVHLNIGPYGAEVNPLLFALPEFTDNEPPVIVSNGITLFDEAGTKLTARPKKNLIVSGKVTIVADAYDRVDGNAAYRRLGVYAIGYQVLDATLKPIPGFEQPISSIEFDRLPSEPDAPQLTFAGGSGITAYGSRITRFRYVVTNIVRHGEATRGAWDTASLPPGEYVVRVIARDLAGNQASQDLKVTVERPQ